MNIIFSFSFVNAHFPKVVLILYPQCTVLSCWFFLSLSAFSFYDRFLRKYDRFLQRNAHSKSCRLSHNLPELTSAVLHFRQHQVDPPRRTVPVLPADAFGRHRTDQNLRLRKADLIVQSGPSGVIRLAAEQCLFHRKPRRVRHFPGAQGVLVSERRLFLPPDTLLWHSLLSQYLPEICPLGLIRRIAGAYPAFHSSAARSASAPSSEPGRKRISAFCGSSSRKINSVYSSIKLMLSIRRFPQSP